MCRECNQTPCKSRCPNADEPKPAHKCAKCRDWIYEGETTLFLDAETLGTRKDKYLCEKCMYEAMIIAERDDE